MAGETSTLTPDRILDNLYSNGLRFTKQVTDILILFVPALKPLFIKHDNIVKMKKARSFATNIDKRSLHSGQYSQDLAKVYVANQTPCTSPLYVNFLQRAAFEEPGGDKLRDWIDN